MRSLNFRNKNNKASNYIGKKINQLKKPRGFQENRNYFKKAYILAYTSWKYICRVKFLTGCTVCFKGQHTENVHLKLSQVLLHKAQTF